MTNIAYDAVIVGSGPNGLSAAIKLQQAGLSVLVLEAKDTVGGGMRTAELTLPGFLHDVCSAIHPLAAASPFFKTLPLKEHGLDFIYPEVSAAHPFDNGTAALLQGGVKDTAATLGMDYNPYMSLVGPLVSDWDRIISDVLGPLAIPKNPLELLNFGIKALRSAENVSKRFFTPEARGLWAGMAAHSMQPLDSATTSAIGMVLLAAGHVQGWPVAAGGSGSIAKALASCFITLGGKISTNHEVKTMQDIPTAKAILFDLSPRQILEIAGDQFSSLYRWQMQRFKYGTGVFKIDWALSEPIPFTAADCRRATTVHLGGSYEEIALSELQANSGIHAEKPFVLLAQQSIIDSSRVPDGKQSAWAYCHVPNNSDRDMTAEIEKQVERFAPGFKDIIIGKHTINSRELQQYNSNYIGGDINGGVLDITQLFTRPVLSTSPYRTSAKGIYICSASTPPGGGVHGMCGFHAARTVLKDVFHVFS